jgi:hypothetical protein
LQIYNPAIKHQGLIHPSLSDLFYAYYFLIQLSGKHYPASYSLYTFLLIHSDGIGDATFGKSSMHNINITFSAFSSGVEHDALLCASTGTQVSTQENDLSGLLTARTLVYFVEL